MTRSLTLWVPGLRGAARAGRDTVTVRLPALANLTARAARTPASSSSDAELRRLFRLDSAAAESLPVAPLTLLADTGTRHAGYWLRADPVHIEAGHDRLIMRGNAQLGLTIEEAQRLSAEINAQMAPEGLRLTVPIPMRWYLSWPEPVRADFAPLPDIISQDMYEYMPAGEEGKPWRRLLNQAQMVLHASPVNEYRRHKGHPAISGLWFWGGGVLPPAHAVRYRFVWADDPLVRGLAVNAGIAPASLPEDAMEWLAGAEEGAHVVADIELAEALRADDVETWRALAVSFDERWLEPLHAALRSGALEELILCPLDGSEYHVTRRSVRRWWRWW